MAQIYDRTDLKWTTRGDYMINNGDLEDTEYDPLRSMFQEIRTRVAADQKDWRVFPTVGGDLRDMVGEPNNKQTAEMIKTRIIGALARDGFIHTRDISIRYMPLDRDKLLLRLTVQVAPTAKNRGSETLVIGMVYNYSDNNVYFMGA